MIFVSVIVPVKKINENIRGDLVSSLVGQASKNFELLLIPDEISRQEKLPSFVRQIASGPEAGPAAKRNLGAKKAKGEFLAFIDDDAYADPDWLKKALWHFENEEVAAVGGPGVTPFKNNLRQKVSGWVWSVWFGAGGAGTYRCLPGKFCEVDDYPTFNLLVRKSDFEAVGGFNGNYWPGEDTKFTHDLVYKLGKKILYEPQALVYHHRREIFRPHLEQISRYALQRGYFAKVLPQTSFKPGYFVPSIFLIGLFGAPVVIFVFEFFSLCFLSLPFLGLYLVGLFFYLTGLFLSALWVFFKTRNLQIALLLIPAIFLTHIVYGLFFIKGLFTKKTNR